MSAVMSALADLALLPGSGALPGHGLLVGAALLPGAKGDPTWLDNPALTKQFLPAIGETLLMTGFSTLFTVALGLPLGLFMVQTSDSGLTPHRTFHRVAGTIINIMRSFPFIILIIAMLPLTRLLVGTTLGWQATVVPLVVGAVPFFARLVETNVHAVDPGKIEAAQMVGASNRSIRWGVQTREALPSLVQSTTTLAITLIGYSAMAGAVGGGGLGQMAINYGYNRFQSDVMISTVIAIIVIVQLIQWVGDMASRLVDHR
jgi:D-methionine transport system permease protein